MVGREQLAHPQGVCATSRRGSRGTARCCRLRGTQQLGERVEPASSSQWRLFLDPDGAHHGSDPGRKNDNDERGGEGRREKYVTTGRREKGDVPCGANRTFRMAQRVPLLLPSPQEAPHASAATTRALISSASRRYPSACAVPPHALASPPPRPASWRPPSTGAARRARTT